MRKTPLLVRLLTTGVVFCQQDQNNQPVSLPWASVSDEGTHFVAAGTAQRIVLWGVNYDHDGSGRLIEDYWHDEWERVAEDFAEIKDLGANIVRVHLQLPKFMTLRDQTHAGNLERLDQLLKLAQQTGL